MLTGKIFTTKGEPWIVQKQSFNEKLKRENIRKLKQTDER